MNGFPPDKLNQILPCLLPQQPPFIFIDKIMDLKDKYARTSYNIHRDSLFLAGEVFQPAGIIEFMAQSGAVYAGSKHLDTPTGPPIGYIASIRNLEILQLPTCNNNIECRVTVLNEILSSLIIGSQVTIGASIIASARLQLFLTE